MDYVWSICIPTYNRAGCLNNCLSYIFKQINDSNRNQIEILVSNNASTDGTADVIDDYIKKGLAISYYANAENIGPDRNFLKCIEKAKGKYVLLLGDDDILLDGSIDTILQVLQEGDYGNVYIANQCIGFQDILPKKQAPAYGMTKKKIYDNADTYIKKVSYFITFMSGNIFNKRLLVPLHSYESFVGSYFIQVSFYLAAILKAKHNVFLSQSFVGSTMDNTGGYKLVKVFGFSFNKILRYFVNNRVIDSINNDLITTYFPHYIMKIRFKDTAYVEENIAKGLFKLYRGNLLYWIFIVPVMKLPHYLAETYYLGIRIYSKIWRESR